MDNIRFWMNIVEAVFTTAPLKKTVFGIQRPARLDAHESDDPVTIYYRLSAGEMQKLLTKHRELRAVITTTEVYVADANEAAHAGLRSVLKEYGIDVDKCVNAIITSPTSMTYAWAKYHDNLPWSWTEVRQMVLYNPRIKIMFPKNLTFVRDEWT